MSKSFINIEGQEIQASAIKAILPTGVNAVVVRYSDGTPDVHLAATTVSSVLAALTDAKGDTDSA